jgi:large subunit ribosomal protein L24
MKRFHVKKGDEVVVVSGASKGRRGRVRVVLPKKERVILEAIGGDAEKKKKEGEEAEEQRKMTNSEKEKREMVRPVLHAMRKTQQNPQGGLMWMEGSVHISNVVKAETYDAKRGAKKSAE